MARSRELIKARSEDKEQNRRPAQPRLPTRSRHVDKVLNLQRTIGNQAVNQLLDKQERNARVSDEPQTIQSQLESGRPLDADVRSQMESAFGRDFSDVRIHTDDKAGELSDHLNAQAFTIGKDIAFKAGEYQPGTEAGHTLIAHELAHVAQQAGAGSFMQKSAAESSAFEADADQAARGAVSSLRPGARGNLAHTAQKTSLRLRSGLQLQRKDGDKKVADPKLLKDFAGKFSDAADLIRKSASAMKLISEAAAAGVTFGGYAEEGPAKAIGRAYTVGSSVYVPKTQTDKVMAMRDFLFELNNAIRAPKFAEIDEEAAKGSKGKLKSAKEYAYKNAELEVEGMLRLGQVWFEMKKASGIGQKWDEYDNRFFLSEYKSFKDGKKTKDEIVQNVLKRKYDTGTLKGKTVEQYYMEEYKRLSGGK